MKSFLSILTLVSAASFTAQAAQKTISCSIDEKASAKLVSEKLEKQPWKKGRTGDDGAILVAGLKEFTLVLDGKKVIGGQLVDEMAYGDDLIVFGKDGETEADNAMVTVTVDSKGVISFDEIYYYDSFHNKVWMSKDGKSASLKGIFQYDCGGEGSQVYAVYTCEVSKYFLNIK